MNSLLTEVQAMQNPALGAALIWRFACGYCPESGAGDGVPVPLAFMVLPIVLHSRTRRQIESTRRSSGLRKFEEKFREEGDTLLAIQHRTLAMRPLSLRSLRLALSSGLITLVPEQGAIWPRSYSSPPRTATSVTGLLSAAEKLGVWSAPLSLFELSGILKVEF